MSSSSSSSKRVARRRLGPHRVDDRGLVAAHARDVDERERPRSRARRRRSRSHRARRAGPGRRRRRTRARRDRRASPRRRGGDRRGAGPPRNRTVVLAGAKPASFAATATAQAPVPHARVSPTPRSHTRTSAVPSSREARELDVRPLGEQLVVPRASGPMCSTWNRSGSSSRNRTRCGFPMLSAARREREAVPRRTADAGRSPTPGPRIGIAAFVKFGLAHLDHRVGRPPHVTPRGPAAVSTSMRSPRRRVAGVAVRYAARQRIPLPDICGGRAVGVGQVEPERRGRRPPRPG